MMSIAAEIGFDPIFLGAHREARLQNHDNWEGWSIRRVGRFFPLLNGRRPLTYLKGIASYWIHLWRELRRIRPSLIHASDFEAAIPAIAFGKLHAIPVIYNIHDNLSQRYSVPPAVSALLNLMEGLAVRAASVALVPEAFRREALPRWCRERVLVVRNAPRDPGYQPPPLHSTGRPIRLLFAGWLDRGRGLEKLAEMVSSDQRLELILAGEGDERLLQTITQMQGIVSRGFLSHVSVMSETARCDFVPALYDPIRPINRFAASNKVAEALAIGRPVIINKEMAVCAELESLGCVVVVQYSEITKMADRLATLRYDSEGYQNMCLRARGAYEKLFEWSKIRSVSLGAYAIALRRKLSRTGGR